MNHALRRHRHRRRGFTMVEILISTAILTMLVLIGLTMLSSGAQYFGNTMSATQSENDTTRAARIIETQLSQARDYTIASDGQSITYYNNDNAYPPNRDATEHRFYRDGNVLRWSDSTRPLLTDLPLTDDNDNDNDNGNTLILFGPVNGRAKDGNCVTVTLSTKQKYTNRGGKKKKTGQSALLRVSARNFVP